LKVGGISVWGGTSRTGVFFVTKTVVVGALLDVATVVAGGSVVLVTLLDVNNGSFGTVVSQGGGGV
jgi:hypothetical protein